jgi:hypothetical protein
MLEIRAAQLKALRDHAERDFRRRLRNHLRATIPDDEMTPAEIDLNIETGINQARDCRLTREVDVARFVGAVCAYLGGFPPEGLPKPALPLLYAYGASPEERLDHFVSWCESQDGR